VRVDTLSQALMDLLCYQQLGIIPKTGNIRCWVNSYFNMPMYTENK